MCNKETQTRFFFFLCFFYKIREQEGETDPAGRGDGTSGRREVAEKGGRRMNMVQKMCTHVCKCKNGTC
jgi:hypothetical protein